MVRLKRVLLAGIGLLLVLLMLPFLVPMDSYRHELERLMTERLHEQVGIGSLHVALLPTPRANIGGIQIGRGEEIRIEKVAVIPDISTLFSSVKMISRVEVVQPVIKQSALGMLKGFIAQPGPPGTAVVIRHVDVKNAQLAWEGLKLPTVDASLAFADTGTPQMATLTSADGKIKADAVPKKGGYAITLDAQHWTLPIGLPLTFDSLNASMKLHGEQFDVSAFSAKLYRGTVDGTATLDWAKGWRAGGKFKAAGIEVGDVAKLAGKASRVSGRLSGSGTFSANAQEATILADRLVVDFRFNVANGVLYGMDLAKAASMLVREGQHGGETRFDQLSGSLHAVGKQYDLSSLEVSSGLLAAHGGVKISSAKKLDGRMDVEIKKGVALVTVPLQISGTVDDPQAMPTKAAMAGAVAGTAVLGPLGTGLGMKAGSALDKLFGSRKK